MWVLIGGWLGLGVQFLRELRLNQRPGVYLESGILG